MQLEHLWKYEVQAVVSLLTMPPKLQDIKYHLAIRVKDDVNTDLLKYFEETF